PPMRPCGAAPQDWASSIWFSAQGESSMPPIWTPPKPRKACPEEACPTRWGGSSRQEVLRCSQRRRIQKAPRSRQSRYPTLPADEICAPPAMPDDHLQRALLKTLERQIFQILKAPRIRLTWATSILNIGR